MKKGLGSIPKSLSWIDSTERIKPVEQVKRIKEKSVEEKTLKVDTKKTGTIQRNSTQKGLPNGWTRATFIVKQELNDRLKALAYWERLTVKEVIHEALTQYMENKKVKPIPKRTT